MEWRAGPSKISGSGSLKALGSSVILESIYSKWSALPLSDNRTFLVCFLYFIQGNKTEAAILHHVYTRLKGHFRVCCT